MKANKNLFLHIKPMAMNDKINVADESDIVTKNIHHYNSQHHVNSWSLQERAFGNSQSNEDMDCYRFTAKHTSYQNLFYNCPFFVHPKLTNMTKEREKRQKIDTLLRGLNDLQIYSRQSSNMHSSTNKTVPLSLPTPHHHQLLPKRWFLAT